MPTAHPATFQVALRLPTRLRSVRRAFHPSPAPGPYRLPHDIRDRLVSALMPYRNRDAAYALAVFLGRFWSVPGRVMGSFPIDRRALADHAALDLTEARVRGAIKALVEVGFIAPAIAPPGSRYRATATGLQRKAVLFAFGVEYQTTFDRANKRAMVARGKRGRVSGCQTPAGNSRPSTAFLTGHGGRAAISPKDKGEAVPVVIMGEVAKGSPGWRVPGGEELDSQVAGALDRLRRAMERRT